MHALLNLPALLQSLIPTLALLVLDRFSLMICPTVHPLIPL